MVHLLLQGLQSSDRTMLNAVIFRHDLEVVNNTVKKLPVDAIQLFIKELENRYVYLAQIYKLIKKKTAVGPQALMNIDFFINTYVHLKNVFVWFLRLSLINNETMKYGKTV